MNSQQSNIVFIITGLILFSCFITLPVYQHFDQLQHHYINNTICSVTYNQYNIYDDKYQLIIEIEDNVFNNTDVLIIDFESFRMLKQGKETYYIGYDFRCMYFPNLNRYYTFQGYEQKKKSFVPFFALIIVSYIFCIGQIGLNVIKMYQSRVIVQNPYRDMTV